MCVIIDVCVVSKLFGKKRDKLTQISNWVNKGKGKVVSGGKNQVELAKAGDEIRRLMAEWKKAGVLEEVDEDSLNAQGLLLKKKPVVSNDVHILQLAAASRTRLIVTEDADLIKDFTNKKVIDKPRGKVFPLGKGTAYQLKNCGWERCKR